MNTFPSSRTGRRIAFFGATNRARVALLMAAASALIGACGGSAIDTPAAASQEQQVNAAFTPIIGPPPPTLLPSPRLVFAPSNATVGLGAGVRFSVFAAGHSPFTYRWHKNGVAVAGAAGAGSNYDINAAVAGDASTYMVRVADRFGSTITASATLAVVQNGWAPLSGRAIHAVAAVQQPSLALCAAPSLAHILPSTNRNALYVKYFDGKRWVDFGAGGILNATATGSASEPSLDCVNDGTTYRPIVAWSEGSGAARDIFVKMWNGTQWVSVGAGALNATPGTNAVRPTLRATPLDANTGNTFINGATRRSAIAWIENGVPTVKTWDDGWLPYGAGVQIPNATNASDIALTIELDEQGRTYPPVLAWLATSGGSLRQFAATHNAGLGTWVMMGSPILGGQNPPSPVAPAVAAGRIGIGVGKFGQGRTPVAFWADDAATPNFRSYMYDSGNFVQGNGGQAWPRYGTQFTVTGALKTTSFDPREFRREGANACGSFGNLPTFGWAISTTSGFEVRRGACGAGLSPADWAVVRTGHNVPLEEISLRMGAPDGNDPWVAGTRLVNGQYQLSVWKFYP